MCFLPDSFFKQSHEGGKYKLWITWFYHKNLLLVVDYVQKYAEEAVRWIEELSTNNSIVASHKYEKAFLKLQAKDADNSKIQATNEIVQSKL